jgi:hypothetical protein
MDNPARQTSSRRHEEGVPPAGRLLLAFEATVCFVGLGNRRCCD